MGAQPGASAWARAAGSAAGAIVAYAMGITDLDPMPNGLMFRHPLAQRVGCPISTSTSSRGRPRRGSSTTIKDVYSEGSRLPGDHLRHAAGQRTPCARPACWTAYGVGDRICKMIGDELGITIDKALD